MNQEERKEQNKYQGPKKRGRNPEFKFSDMNDTKIKDHPDISEQKFKPRENFSASNSNLDKKLDGLIQVHHKCLSRISFLYALSYVTWLAFALRILYLEN